MRKGLRYFFDECRSSKFFLIVMVLELACCIILISIVTHSVTISNVANSFYSNRMADKVFIESTEDKKSLDEIDAISDVENFATVSVIGSYEGQDIKVVTPTLIKNMPSLGLKFSKKLPKDYREIYMDQVLAKDLGFEKGAFYDIVIDGEEQIAKRVKVLGFFDKHFYYYEFRGRFQVLTNFNEIIMCDTLDGGATVYGGMFFDDIDPILFKRIGYNVSLGKNLVSDSTINSMMVYMAIVISILTFACLMTNYFTNAEKMRRRVAVQFVVGATYKSILFVEVLKMLSALAVAIVLNSIVVAFIKTEAFNGTGLASFKSMGIAIGAISACYVTAISVGMFRITRMKLLAALNGEIKD